MPPLPISKNYSTVNTNPIAAIGTMAFQRTLSLLFRGCTCRVIIDMTEGDVNQHITLQRELLEKVDSFT